MMKIHSFFNKIISYDTGGPPGLPNFDCASICLYSSFGEDSRECTVSCNINMFDLLSGCNVISTTGFKIKFLFVKIHIQFNSLRGLDGRGYLLTVLISFRRRSPYQNISCKKITKFLNLRILLWFTIVYR